MLEVLQYVCLSVLVALSLGSLLNLSTHAHWFIRGWDFPRLQILALGLVAAIAYFAIGFFCATLQWDLLAYVVVALMFFLVVWHAYRILPYTQIWPRQTLSTTQPDGSNSIRLVVSNVEMYNDQYQRWQNTIDDSEPDVALVLEVNEKWLDELQSWRQQFAHEVAQPQDNCYGMLLVSNLPIESSTVEFVVEDDIPSIDAILRLRSGQTVRFLGVHPRPPEPIRDVDSATRDAEMMLHGRRLEKDDGPIIIAGDFNDVAWSRTTRLFLRISDLLDPRRGRGLINTFHAQYWFLRFPLDHVFHSRHFSLRELRRLPKVGSDHFPILTELQLDSKMFRQQESLEASSEDHQLADELIEKVSVDAGELHRMPPSFSFE